MVVKLSKKASAKIKSAAAEAVSDTVVTEVVQAVANTAEATTETPEVIASAPVEVEISTLAVSEDITPANTPNNSAELLKIRIEGGVRERNQTIIVSPNFGAGKERWFDKKNLVSFKVEGETASMVMERRYLRTRGMEDLGTVYATDAEVDSEEAAA